MRCALLPERCLTCPPCVVQGTVEDPGLTLLAVAELLQLRQAFRGPCQLGMLFVELYLDR